MGTGRGTHGCAAKTRVASRTVASVWRHTHSVVLTGRVAHRLTLGGVVGADRVALLTATVEPSGVVEAQLLTATVCEVPTLVHVQTAA